MKINGENTKFKALTLQTGPKSAAGEGGGQISWAEQTLVPVFATAVEKLKPFS